MKNIIFFLLTITFSLSINAQAQKIFYKNGNIQFNVTYNEKDMKIGLFEHYYENGQLKVKTNYNNKGNEEHGLYIKYHENGNVHSKGNYENGNEIGDWVYYYENGKIEAKSSYKNGHSVDFDYYYFKNGKIALEDEYDENGNEIVSKEYYENGVLMKIKKYLGNDRTFVETYHENGKKDESGEREGIDKVGLWKEYHENGILFSIGEYNDSKKVGCWEFYHENGTLWQIGDFNNLGGKTGEWNVYSKDNSTSEYQFKEEITEYIDYYKGGKIRIKGNYTNLDPNGFLNNGFVLNGDKCGIWEYYYKNGQLQRIGNYSNVREEYEGGNGHKFFSIHAYKNGVWRFYYKSGQLYTKVEYKNGNIWNVPNLYDIKGKSLDMGTIKNGNGTVKDYDENGKLIEEINFINGEHKK